ncbi:PstS family phosphate ABC transporter substrate-binding protein [Anaerobranca gottschalkii]|uniref:Phosphate-binding protein n=1 Tax=Anaerobranca gottschalkii DSM 13577 TaxID=1120990 RepID=A0A1I0AHS9_9FIRM|nr:PstS family phosphate ABC transporter substrate-binding protein [Anaerobranca gottschalkii]SES92823.1 phosphate ABC transporter substrate-binding protein, PhoT family [Anaerobranca gottschalkii DSM 13577]
MFKKGFISVITILLVTFSLVGCGGNAEKYIEVKGSDTMVNLGQHWAEAFMAKNPEVTISVTGGGSGTGIAAIQNDNTHIAQSSRPMTETEIENAKANNVQISEFIVGQDGLAVVVNAKNPVSDLTMAQLKDIFTGKITHWSELGWEEGGEITLYSRQSNSGTYVYFWQTVLHEEDWAPDTMFMPGSSAIYEAVSSDENGIGYFGVGYVKEGVKAINVARTEAGPYITPLKQENIDNGIYPIARPLYFYINGKPEGVVLDYLKFVLSEEGEKVLYEVGFYAITPAYKEQNRKTFEKLGIK